MALGHLLRLRLLVLAPLTLAAALAQTLPPTPTTQQLPNGPKTPQEIYDRLLLLQQQQQSKTTPAQSSPGSPAQRAIVDFTAGRLAISADNSSLNQILRDIARVTGMKITGGVNDERVFGSYGPADTSSVLSALLNGTGSNMLLLFNDQSLPSELVLTPRQGGPTPPNPNALREPDVQPSFQPDLPPQRQPRTSAPAVNFTPPNAVPQGRMPQPASTDPTTTQQSPNGVKTPQQIYDQLMQLQQQQPKTPPQ